MAVGDAYMFPGFLTLVLTQLFLPKPRTTFLTCFCRGERRKYAGKKSRLNWGSNSQPPGHESDTLATEPRGQGIVPYEQIRSQEINKWNTMVIFHLYIVLHFVDLYGFYDHFQLCFSCVAAAGAPYYGFLSFVTPVQQQHTVTLT